MEPACLCGVASNLARPCAAANPRVRGHALLPRDRARTASWGPDRWAGERASAGLNLSRVNTAARLSLFAGAASDSNWTCCPVNNACSAGLGAHSCRGWKQAGAGDLAQSLAGVPSSAHLCAVRVWLGWGWLSPFVLSFSKRLSEVDEKCSHFASTWPAF